MHQAPLTGSRRVVVATSVVLLLILALLASGGASSSQAQESSALDLEHLDGVTAIEMMENGELTSVELTQAYIDRINALNQAGPGLNAVSQLNEHALEQAAELDEMRANGEILGPAHGLPILLKDLIDVEGMYTSAGNYSLRDSYPETDSGVAKKLRENGLVILGKLGLSEYANYFGNQPSGFANLTGQVLNAVDADQNPSGSSSGTGAAGAAALSTLTIGTETSGSIISPSQAQGLVGLRPTVGLVPGYGIAPISASQDTAGPMDRTVANAALTLSSIAGSDPLDDHEGLFGDEIDDEFIIPKAPDPVPDYLSALDLEFVEGKRIAYAGSSDMVLQAVQVLEDAGAEMVEVTIPSVSTPSSVLSYEAKRDINRYYDRLGDSAPIKSLEEEIADNEANAHEALKFGNATHVAAQANDISEGSAATATYEQNLVQGKEVTRDAIDGVLENNTPDDTSDDFIAILNGFGTGTGARAGYPQITIPMGYTSTHRRAQALSIGGTSFSERDLIGVGYVLEQGTKLRQPVSEVNPSMYRCADTVPAPSYSERGGCNPDYEELEPTFGEVPELDFDLETTSAQELSEMIEAGEISSEELTKAYLARIAVANANGSAVQAVREINPDAVAEATELDAELAEDGARGPLHGLPVLLDDSIDVEGLPTTGGSIALQEHTPSEDARLVRKLELAGAVILGKTNVSELGGLFNSNMPEGYSSLAGQVLLPSDADKTPAGSSAGAAAATASGMAAMTVGRETSTDTAQLVSAAGAAGVVGLKPTVGRVSRTGVMPVAKSLDSPGPITQTVYDAALQLEAIAGSDYQDTATTSAPAATDYTDALSADALDGKKVAVADNTSTSYPEAITSIQGAGATTSVVSWSAPSTESVVTREFERDLDDYLADGSGGDAGSLEEIIEYNADNPVEGLKYDQRELESAAEVDLSDSAELADYESDLDANLEANQAVIDGILDNGTPSDDSDDFDVIAVNSGSNLIGIADQAGYPVLSVPAGYGVQASSSGRNPIPVVFIGSAYDEEELLADGYAFEQATEVRLAPSYTNPSMWRCVELSEFYSPHHCRPGEVTSLTEDSDDPDNTDDPDNPADPDDAQVGGPELSLKAKPGKLTVGAKKEAVEFTAVVKNTGDATSGAIEVCAKAPAKKLKLKGSQCVSRELEAGAKITRSFKFKVKKKARGKTTSLTFTADGSEVEKAKATAELKVKKKGKGK